jgi:hypothetical protein
MNIETIHLVLGGSAAGTVAALVSGEAGQRVVPLDDNLSMGPLFCLDTPDGIAERRRWIKTLFKTIYADFAFDEIMNGIGLPVLDELGGREASFIIWCGPNADEQLMLRAVMAKLQGKAVKIVDVGPLQTMGHSPKAVAQCPPDALRRAFSEARTPGDRQIQSLGQEWVEQLSRTGTLRVFREGRIVDVSEDHFDAAIRAAVPPEFGIAAKVVGRVLGESEDVIGDAFINYRLRRLIEAGLIEAMNAEGHLLSMKVRQHI